MAGFDPAAATAAYIAKIPAAVQASAERHAEAGVLAWALGWTGALLLAALVLRSGLIEQARRRAGAGGVVLLLALVSCAWGLAVKAVREGALPATSPGGLCAALLVQIALFAAALGLLRAAGSRPRLWLSATAVLGAFLLVFGPAALSELGPSLASSASGPAAQAAMAAARASGVEAQGVDVSAAAPGEGDVVGLFRPARLLLTPQAVSEAGLPEIKAAAGHVLGHYRARDGLGWAATLSALGLLGAVFVVGAFRPARRLLGGPKKSPTLRFRPDERGEGLADPHGLPVVWALACCWMAIAQPAAFAWDRAINLRADRFSLEHVREPDGLAQALVRENGLSPVDPTPLELWLTCSHPALKARIEQAMAWKATQTGVQAAR